MVFGWGADLFARCFLPEQPSPKRCACWRGGRGKHGGQRALKLPDARVGKTSPLHWATFAFCAHELQISGATSNLMWCNLDLEILLSLCYMSLARTNMKPVLLVFEFGPHLCRACARVQSIVKNGWEEL